MSGYLVTLCKSRECNLVFRVREEPVTVLGRLAALHEFPKEFQCPHCQFEMWVYFDDVRLDTQ
jgi:hypothetical protein